MLAKIQTRLKQFPWRRFRDVRFLGLMAFGVIALLVTWSGLGAIQTNFELQKQIGRLQEENKVEQLMNQNLALQNEYFKTDHYLELEARRQFGKAAPGEKVVLIPEEVALAHTVDMTPPTIADESTTPTKPTYQQNFEAWMRFFMNRPQIDYTE